MKKIKEITITDIFGVIHTADIFALGKENFNEVKDFIIYEHSLMDNKDFFIVEDIDESLPKTLDKNKGIFMGIYVNGSLIATEGIDLFCDTNMYFENVNINNFRHYKFAEIGWTMVSNIYRGNNLSSVLTQCLEKYLLKLDTPFILCATVHPENVACLKSFFKEHYKGYDFNYLYEYARLLLVKYSLNLSRGINEFDKIWVKCADHKKLKAFFMNKYYCDDIRFVNQELCLGFNK